MSHRAPVTAPPPPVVHLFKVLNTAPEPSDPSENPCVEVRDAPTCELDVQAWLSLQNVAFLRPRPWNEGDFRRELAERDWFPSSVGFHVASRDAMGWSGSVILELPVKTERQSGRIHWLAVAPQQRRRGIGRRLMNACERECWKRGLRVMELETLRSWQAAIGFYDSLGYSEWSPGPQAEQNR